MICQGWRLSITIVLFGLAAAGCRSAARPTGAPTAVASLPPVDEAEPANEAFAYDAGLNLTRPASFSMQEEQIPAPSTAEPLFPVPSGVFDESETSTLELLDVIRAVEASYPLLVTTLLERDVADGKQLSAQGEFDLSAKLFSISAPEGFYETYRNGLSFDQPLFTGGYLYSGYKIGDGNFQPWFGERETNEGGEFALGFGVPLLKDRAIDDRRADLFQADLTRQAVEPVIRGQFLEFVRVATQSYWMWVAAGRMVSAQRELLQNAQARIKQIEDRVELGDLKGIVGINNEQLIAARETKLIEAERKLQQAAIKLSLFYRNARGEPVVPSSARLPSGFPTTTPPNSEQIAADIGRAIDASPELAELALLSEQVRVELSNAENSLLPKLDAQLLASKDVGARASPKGDKTPFELEVALLGEVPLQRREARGKIVAARGKLAQIDAKRQFVVNKLTAAVQDSVSALQAAAARIERAERNLELARQTLELGRFEFQQGDVSLIELNIYEQSVTDAQLLLVSAIADFFFALADYRAALALEPIVE